MIYPNFIGPAYRSQSVIADGEVCINWYLERLESPGGANRQVLYPTPGVSSLVGASSGSAVQQLYAINGRVFAAIGTHLYQVDPVAATLTNLGTIIEDTNQVTLSCNGAVGAGRQVFVTAGGQGNIYNIQTGAYSANVISTATAGAMIDGYFLALDSATSTIYCSNYLDGTTWDPTQYVIRSSQPDPWKTCVVNFNELWLLGEQTSEVWYDAGTAPFPFAQRPGSMMQTGIAATQSAAVLEGMVIWLAQTPAGTAQIVGAQGYNPQRISTHAVEYAISQYDTVTDAVGWSYQDQGHAFYVLNFPSAHATWCWDKTENEWHQRGTWISADRGYDDWHARSHCVINGVHLVGDSNAPTIYTLDITNGLDFDSRPIRRVRRPPSMQSELEPLFFGALTLELEVGLGTVSGQGRDPTISLRTSRNGGQTWGSERVRSAGPMGQYGHRVIWQRNGFARNFVPELVVCDPIPWRLVNAFIEVTPADDRVSAA